MLKWVRRATLLGALGFVLVAAFDFNPERDGEIAWRAYRAGDMDQALRLARRAALFLPASDPQNTGLLELEAKAAQKLKRPDMAMGYLDKMVADFPSHAWGYLARGDIRLQQGDAPGALADLDRGLALAVGPEQKPSRDLAKMYALRAQANLDLNRPDQARRDVDVAMAADPNDPRTRYALARVLEREGQLMPALKQCELALRLAQRRDMGFFLGEEGDKWLERLVLLRMKNKVDPTAPIGEAE